ncbi:poly(A) polymerase small subunit [Nile crocodilepox virus]|uniref:Cap-specific mRNA (nucleoside-2'-O-)-methyltransferase n=1 Tax=Nile crocodilepox virus (isolate Crocodylus niloticus/Zimbabwe/Ume/2001) TaxID=1289473 RepID=Q070F5_CPRVZ|nr:poly(A) polymerase small subunit [Nile crocodilepox virus]ABJ08987.1 poly(A) polymerase small subunit [Nile crocodilepox virus]
MAGTISMPKPYLFFSDLSGEEEYSADYEQRRFRSQGQLKLLLGELYFLDQLSKAGTLSGSPTVVYIGSAPGTHIRYLRDHFAKLGYELRWVLIDGREHDASLRGLPDVELVTRFVNEAYLHRLRAKLGDRAVVLISDIRAVRDGEPRTEDMLEDYRLQNKMVEVLKPVAFSLKWRCPFPDQWTKDFVVIKGAEFLQPFRPSYSTEMRLLSLNGRPLTIRHVTLDAAKEYERKLFYLNHRVRRCTVLSFDFYNQGYDYFHAYWLLKDLSYPAVFQSEKIKAAFLLQEIFDFLGIK